MRHTIATTDASAAIDARDGGRLVSLVIRGFDVIGGAPPVPGEHPGWFHGSFPMAPYAGRMRDARVRFEGETFPLEPNVGSHAAHGIVFDRPWTTTHSTATRLELSIALDDRWPWGGTVTQVIDLRPGVLAMVLGIRNEERRMPAALGYHPWFARHAPGGDAVLRFEPARRYEMDADGFTHAPTGDLGTRPWDDVFRDLASRPAIGWPGGPSVELSSSAEVWTVFERLDAGLCVEPLTAPPNALGTPYAAIVAPGRPLELRFSIHWAVDSPVQPAGGAVS